MKVAIVGAGLAGLAAGCELSDLGDSVTLFEKRPFAGGKTYSFSDAQTGEVADNGQHVFMRCTTAYTGFLERIGTLRLTRRQRRLCVRVYDARGRERRLRADPLPAPFHLLPSFAVYTHLPVGARLRVARAMLAALRMSEANRLALWTQPFDEWLRRHGQRDTEITRFWDFLLLPTLNARSGAVAASDALFVLREGFLASSESAALGISAVPLSQLHVDPAIAYIEARGGRFVPDAAIDGLCADGTSAAITRAGGERENFDAVVCATGHLQALRLLPAEVLEAPAFRDLSRLPTAPIVNLHLWFDRPIAPFAMAAFADSELQWVFNRARLDRASPTGSSDEHLVISLSAAQPYMALTRAELQQRLLPLIEEHLPRGRTARLRRFAVIKEPEATFVPAPGIVRPPNATTIRNLVVAGAYTATGWPATMESAVRSGLAAARQLHEQCSREHIIR